WYADYLIERALTEKDLEGAMNILTWVADHALPSGVLAEQVHPFTGQPLSVSPLTWSHATFVATINRFIRRLNALKDYPGSGLSLIEKARREDWIGKLYKEACDSIHESCKT
ncbi:MAG: glycoside hydrolase family 15 protein, partial [Desulfomonilia bacterium]|nr:glycoside hydrolase family 15 protein [Desulfomonilia bacterium]